MRLHLGGVDQLDAKVFKLIPQLEQVGAVASKSASVRGHHSVRSLDDSKIKEPIELSLVGIARAEVDEGALHTITDLRVRPEISVWRKSLADGADRQDLAPYIADELFRTSDPNERDALFKTTTFQEAKKLRRTAGLFAQYYKGKPYKPFVRGRVQFQQHHRGR